MSGIGASVPVIQSYEFRHWSRASIEFILQPHENRGDFHWLCELKIVLAIVAQRIEVTLSLEIVGFLIPAFRCA